MKWGLDRGPKGAGSRLRECTDQRFESAPEDTEKLACGDVHTDQKGEGQRGGDEDELHHAYELLFGSWAVFHPAPPKYAAK